jgi:hypothetical protein
VRRFGHPGVISSEADKMSDATGYELPEGVDDMLASIADALASVADALRQTNDAEVAVPRELALPQELVFRSLLRAA